MIHEQRIQGLNTNDLKEGDYVLYWMQASQRVHYNHALEYSIGEANRLKKPLLVYFGITSAYPDANERHYHFMLEGLKDTEMALNERGIQMVVVNQSPENGVIEVAKKACMVITDRGYTRIQRQWRDTAAKKLSEKLACPLFQVESDVVVPVERVSNKEEYAAATIRRKINPLLPQYMQPLNVKEIEVKNPDIDIETVTKVKMFDISNTAEALDRLDIDRRVSKGSFTGGTSQALILLEDFIENRLAEYHTKRNEPCLNYTSDMSPYLHFGQISPLYIAMRATSAKGIPDLAREAFLEELIVRRELSMNFVFFNPYYDSPDCLPQWVRQTLIEHENDPRPYIYSCEELEQARTHDPYWNAAQQQMVNTGKMQGYMRMYWGKKILEWMPSTGEAYKTALYLNDKYNLDGRDPNGFAGVAWCFGKHDRPWKERAIFGKVRYMNAKGLERKFDMKKYLNLTD